MAPQRPLFAPAAPPTPAISPSHLSTVLLSASWNQGMLADPIEACLETQLKLTKQDTHLMLQDIYKATQLVQALQLYEDRSEGVVQDGAEGVHQGRQRAAVAVRLWEEVLKQLMLHLAHLPCQTQHRISESCRTNFIIKFRTCMAAPV